LFLGDGKGFFHEDRFALLQRFDYEISVLVVTSGDKHRIGFA